MDKSRGIGLRIKEIRLKKNINQTEYAEKIGITRAALWQIETEKIKPSLEVLYKISEVSQVSMDYLLLGETRLIFSDLFPEESNPITTKIYQIVYAETRNIIPNLLKLVIYLENKKLITPERQMQVLNYIDEFDQKNKEWIEKINSLSEIDHQNYLSFFQVYNKLFVFELNSNIEILLSNLPPFNLKRK